MEIVKGYASGWRFRCPKCGATKPLAETGAIRIGAWSIGKRVLGFCRRCRWFRWFVVEKFKESDASAGS